MSKRVLLYSVIGILGVGLLAYAAIHRNRLPSSDSARAAVPMPSTSPDVSTTPANNRGAGVPGSPRATGTVPVRPEEFVDQLSQVVDQEQIIGQKSTGDERDRMLDELAAAVPELIQILANTTDESLAFRVCSVLERIGYFTEETNPNVLKPAEETLLNYMQSDIAYPHKGVAARALAHICPLSEKSVGTLVSELDTPGLKSNGLIALASAMDYNDLARATVVNALKDTADPYRSFLAAQGIIFARESDSPEVQQIMADNLLSEHLRIREGAISYFSRFAETHPEIAKIGKVNLIETIKGPSDDKLKPSALRAAAYAYGALEDLEGNDELLDAMIECAMDQSESQASRRMAIGAITAFAHTSPKVHRAVSILKQDPKENIRKLAISRAKLLR